MKQCILVDNKICNDCGECMRCDLDANKICDNCGKCLQSNDNNEFRSLLVRADEMNKKPKKKTREQIKEEKEQEILNAFLDLPIDLELPEPIEVDPALAAEWEEKLKAFESADTQEDREERMPEIGIHGVRKRRKR